MFPQHLHMLGDNFVIAAREWTGPSGTQAEALVVLEHLLGHGQKCAYGLATLHAERHEQLHRGFDDDQRVTRSQSACGMIERLVARFDWRRRRTESPRDFSRRSHRHGVTLDGEDFPL